MRPDMSKIVVERPRRGHKDCYKPIRRRENRGDPESLPSSDGMRAPHIRHYEGKEFSDNLSPLYRYLDSQIGRNWDEVFSEISAQIRGNSTVHRHILQHLFQHISLNMVRRDDGGLEEHGRMFFNGYMYHALYVDPDTKVIKRNPDKYKHHKYAPPENPDHKVFGPEDEVVRIKGCWHRVFFATAEGPQTKIDSVTGNPYTINRYSYDIVTSKQVLNGRYRAATRQLDSKNLRRLGLTNEEMAA